MLCHEISSPPVRLLLSVLVLKDAGRNHHAVPSVDPVVSHESGDFADDGYKALLHLAPCLARVGHALVPPYRNVHSFCTTSFATLHTSNNHSGYFRSREESLSEVMVEAI